MKSIFSLVAGIALLVVSSANLLAQSKTTMGTTEYFPLKVGTTWTYATSEGVVVTKVVKHESIDGYLCARMEVTMSDNKKTSEYIRITNDGVYRHQASEQKIAPPLMFLKLGAKNGDSWAIDSLVLGKRLKGKYTLTTGELTVKEKKYTDVLIVKSDDFEIDAQKLPHTYYFAKGVGIVKQVVKFAGEEVVMELQEMK